MLREIDNFYLQKEEPIKSCLIELRKIILNYEDMTESWKYKMPCYLYKGKFFCYVWTDKKTHAPYILMVEGKKIDHPKLETGNRARMKIFLLDPKKDIPIKIIDAIFKIAFKLYK